MADLEKIVRIIFAGDASPLAKSLNSVSAGLDNFSGNVKRATQPIADFTADVAKIDAVMAGMAVGSLVVATTAAGKFGDSFAEISTLIEAPAGALAEFNQDIIDYARDSGASFDQITGATYQIISATGDWESALERLSVAEKLNIAGKGDLNDTAKLLATSMNAYGAASGDAADYSDVLFKTVKIGVTNLTELSASLGTVTGLAASAGVPFDDLSSAVGALTGTVGDTSLAVTQVKSILSAIVKPSEQAKKAAEDLEIAFDKQTLAAMGLDKFLRMVYEAAEGDTEIMAKLFGRVEGLNGALVLGADTSGKYADALAQMKDRAGAVEAAYQKMADQFSLSNQKIVNNIQATLIEVGTPLLDEYGALADGISDIFKSVSIGFNAGSFDPLFDWIQEKGAELATLFKGIADALPDALEDIDWTGFTDALDDLVNVGKGILKDIFGDLDLTDADDLAAAIQKIIGAFERWTDLTAGIIQGLGPLFDIISDLLGKISKMDGDVFELAGKFAGWGTAINLVAGFLPNLTAPLSLLSSTLSIIALTRFPLMTKGLTALIPTLGAASTALGGLVKGAAAFGLGWTIGTVLRENVPIVKEAGDALGELGYNILHWGDKSIEAKEKQAQATLELGKLAVQAALAGDKVKELPEKKVVTVDSELTGFFAEIDLEEWKLNNLEGYTLKVEADTQQAEEALERVSDWNKIILEDGSEILLPIKVESAQAIRDAAAAKKKIDDALPAQKLLEIELQGEIDTEIARIKANAETLQTAFEWKAKIDIAEFEAQAEIITALSENISAMFISAGDVITSALGTIANVSVGSPAFHLIEEALEAELKIRQGLFQLQKDLTEAEVDQIKARTEAIKKGKGLVTIKAEGLQAELSMVLEKIVQLAQIEANSEGFNALLGI